MADPKPVSATVYVQQAARAAEVRTWLNAADWAGDHGEVERGLVFTVDLGGTGSAAVTLDPAFEAWTRRGGVAAQIAALCAGRMVGPALGLAERLARTLAVNALAVVAFDVGGEGWSALVTWYGAHLAGFELVGPGGSVDDRVAAFLADQDVDDVADLPRWSYAASLRLRLLGLAGLLTVLASTWLGGNVGAQLGYRGVGAAIGFYGAVGTGFALLIYRRGLGRLGPPTAVAALGLAALGAARALGPSDAALGVGVVGMVCVGVGGVWAVNRL